MKRRNITDPEVSLFVSCIYTIASSTEPNRRAAWLKLKQAADEDKLKLFNTQYHLKGWLAQMLAR